MDNEANGKMLADDRDAFRAIVDGLAEPMRRATGGVDDGALTDATMKEIDRRIEEEGSSPASMEAGRQARRIDAAMRRPGYFNAVYDYVHVARIETVWKEMSGKEARRGVTAVRETLAVVDGVVVRQQRFIFAMTRRQLRAHVAKLERTADAAALELRIGRAYLKVWDAHPKAKSLPAALRAAGKDPDRVDLTNEMAS